MKLARFDLHEIDTKVIAYLNKISLPVLRISLAITFIWFGALKPFSESLGAGLVVGSKVVPFRADKKSD